MHLEPRLQSLYFEQAQLQTGRERSRTLKEYSMDFGKEKTWLKTTLEHLITSNNHTTYVDLGCGNTVALREALMTADSLSSMNKLTAIGIDILPPDLDKLGVLVQLLPALYDPNILRDVYAPEVIVGDIDTVQFPQPADLVTLSSVLFWTHDPLKALANAAAQTKVGGIICANELSGIHESLEENTYRSLFRGKNGEFSGFEALNRIDVFASEIILRKLESLDSPEAVLTRWFGNIPSSRERIPVKSTGVFSHYYKFPQT